MSQSIQNTNTNIHITHNIQNTLKDSTQSLTRQINRCETILHNTHDPITSWRIRDDLAKANHAILLGNIPEMNHMVAVLMGYRENKVRENRVRDNKKKKGRYR